jgi:hypothetical protein
MGDTLQGRVVPQVGGVVGILVARRDLVDALPQQRQDIVAHIAAIAGIGHRVPEGGGQSEPVVELADEEQARVGRDLAAIEGDRQLAVETEAESTMTLCSHRHLPAAVCDAVVDNRVFSTLGEGRWLSHAGERELFGLGSLRRPPAAGTASLSRAGTRLGLRAAAHGADR